MISQSTIDQVFETARVEEVIGDFVDLKKSGANYKGLSPFSDEKTPSFMVSPAKQIWKDFSSGKGGNTVTFLMEHEQFSYPEAIRYLANKYGIKIEETERTEEEKALLTEKDSLFLVNDFANIYFQDILWNAEKGKAIGLSYLKERGFSKQIIKDFNLGYCLDEWDAFTKEAIKEGHKLEYLEKTGLTIIKEESKKNFDRFKGRIMFPIQSISGRILGFGGRILVNDKKSAKYVNSPESIIYNKSQILYGIYQAKQTIVKENNCYLVEGYTDVVQLYQSGIKNVVASGGTALTPEQIKLMQRLTHNITILYDGDLAGQKASLRGIDIILQQGMNVHICSFPEGEDPDSFAKKTPLNELIQYFEDNKQDFITFKANILYENTKKDPVKKAETIAHIITSISKIENQIQQEIYIKECARIMDVSENALFSVLSQTISTSKIAENKKQRKKEQTMTVVDISKTEDVDHQVVLEKKIIEILLLYGHLEANFDEPILKETEGGTQEIIWEKVPKKIFEKIYTDLHQDELSFSNELFSVIYEKIISIFNRQNRLEIDVFIKDCNEIEAEIISSILMENEKYELHKWDLKNVFVPAKETSVAQLTQETICDFRHLMISKLVETLAQNITKSSDNTENELSIMQQVNDYKQLDTVISNRLGRRIVG